MQSTAPMDDILMALDGRNDELDALVSGLDEECWSRPPQCAGWSIADVVLHVAQTNEAAVASARGRPDGVAAVFCNAALNAPPSATVDDMVALVVAAERGCTGKEIYKRWRTSAWSPPAASTPPVRHCRRPDRTPPPS
ncbi:MAG TPA: maleylpyruvate isomerase N-terminal domain-containing protein [Acidimicrobiia bacterium]|nr:maleylpyruvate isomerase N-terminal domain-containing protein [Acidimicrobiia bacterium]